VGILSNIKFAFSAFKFAPHLAILSAVPKANAIFADMRVWAIREGLPSGSGKGWTLSTALRLLVNRPEFRTLFYYRLRAARLFAFLATGERTLFINTQDIGPGLYIQHGFATIIAAKSIGANCWINQQVTIGYSSTTDAPAIGDNVTINAGAKVIGGIQIGSGSKIGANAVVVKNVPLNCTVVGVPGRIVRKDGERVDLPL